MNQNVNQGGDQTSEFDLLNFIAKVEGKGEEDKEEDKEKKGKEKKIWTSVVKEEEMIFVSHILFKTSDCDSIFLDGNVTGDTYTKIIQNPNYIGYLIKEKSILLQNYFQHIKETNNNNNNNNNNNKNNNNNEELNEDPREMIYHTPEIKKQEITYYGIPKNTVYFSIGDKMDVNIGKHAKKEDYTVVSFALKEYNQKHGFFPKFTEHVFWHKDIFHEIPLLTDSIFVNPFPSIE